MKEVCHFVPDYIPEGKPARVVMYGDFGVPCGGTHVSSLSEIKHMTIRKIKGEGGNQEFFSKNVRAELYNSTSKEFASDFGSPRFARRLFRTGF